MVFQSKFCSLNPESQFSPNIWTNDVDNRECKVNEGTAGDYGRRLYEQEIRIFEEKVRYRREIVD